MQNTLNAIPWRKFSLRLTALIVVAIVGGWALSHVFASRSTSTVGARAPAEASVLSPMELMIRRGPNLPPAEYVEPF